MASETQTGDGPQNQHYVPKFILRNFLSNADKEQVTVFDKRNGKCFTPNIAGIMAERRFHDFQISDDDVASFESVACRLEDELLPTYRRILEDRRLTHSDEEKWHLALLVAFQFLRTRRQRERFLELDEVIGSKLERMGSSLEKLEGYQELTEDRLKAQHATFIASTITEFTRLVIDKHMMLIGAPTDRDFYISDNPVVLHNSGPSHPWVGNIGFGVKGIEIYLPLGHDLLLAVYCPSILDGAIQQLDDALDDARAALFPLVLSGQISASQMKRQIDQVEYAGRRLRNWHRLYVEGEVDVAADVNMDFFNSLQLNQASRFIISKTGDFALAKTFMKDFPGHRPAGIETN